MDDALGWERALSSEFSADNKRLLVAGVKFGGVGEIAIYSVDGLPFPIIAIFLFLRQS